MCHSSHPFSLPSLYILQPSWATLHSNLDMSELLTSFVLSY